MEAGSGGGGSSVRPLTLACLALAQTREAEPLCQQRRARTRPPLVQPKLPPFPCSLKLWPRKGPKSRM